MLIRALVLVAIVWASAPGANASGSPVGQAFQPDANTEKPRSVSRVRLESLTYVRAPKPKKPKFELKDGDRVVFLGNTLIERAQKYGYWETMLTARYPDRKIIFRNLGWDGDTVWAESRGIFGTPAKGYADMLKHVGRIKPTVLFLGYGNNEAFAGKKGLPRFVKQYNKLLDNLTKVSAKGVRFVIIVPHRRLRMPGPYPDPDPFNRVYEQYVRSIVELARRRSIPVVGQFIHSIERKSGSIDRIWDKDSVSLTTNGSHLKEHGYLVSTFHLVNQIDQLEHGGAPSHSLIIDWPDIVRSRHGYSKFGIKKTNRGLRFATRTDYIEKFQPTIYVRGLPAGKYLLRIDNEEVKSASSKSWSKGKVIQNGPDTDQYEKLRKAIIAKNRLYFHSWRPQNITYLFLFRKHEQGQNAKDVKEFLKLVAAKEKEIDRLKKPVTRTYELIRVKTKPKPKK